MAKDRREGDLTSLFDIANHQPDLKPQLVKTTPAREKLVDKAVEIRQNDPTVGYLSPDLIMCTLPHKDPGNVPRWVRRNPGIGLTMTIQPVFKDAYDDTPLYPWGSTPRLILLYIVAQAVTTKKPEIYFDHRFNKVLEQIGLNTTSGYGPRSSASRLIEQMERLTRAVIRFDRKDPGRRSWSDFEISPKGMVWWNREEGEHRAYLKLSPDFYEMARFQASAMDMRVAVALRKSPLAMDLCALGSYMSKRYGDKGGFEIRLEDLRQQLGAEYKTEKNFSIAIKDALAKIKGQYPGLKAELTGEHLKILKGSRPQVAFPSYRKRDPETGELIVEIGRKEIHKVNENGNADA